MWLGTKECEVEESVGVVEVEEKIKRSRTAGKRKFAEAISVL